MKPHERCIRDDANIYKWNNHDIYTLRGQYICIGSFLFDDFSCPYMEENVENEEISASICTYDYVKSLKTHEPTPKRYK